jgi:L-rhamnose-H+ transport protein
LLNVRNKTGHEYLSSKSPGHPNGGGPQPIEETALSGPSTSVLTSTPAEVLRETVRVPLTMNYLWCALAGVTWYMQFFFYTMGETQMGAYKFSSWTIHMASIVIFSSLWGIGLKEWKGAGRIAHTLLALGLAVLVGSTVIIGYGNYLATLH